MANLRTAALYAVADMRTCADELREPNDPRYSPLRRAADRLREAIEEADKQPPPQVYVYLTSGGILEWSVTRGDVDVVHADWDENADYSAEDWTDMRARLDSIADPDLRAQELASVDEELEKLRAEAEADAIAEEEDRQRRIAAARELLQREGVTPA